MSVADEIDAQLIKSLEIAENKARTADAAMDVTTFENAKAAYDSALKERADVLKSIKPETPKIVRMDGESPGAADGRAHHAQALSEASAEGKRIGELETMKPMAVERDAVKDYLDDARSRMDALKSEGQRA